MSDKPVEKTELVKSDEMASTDPALPAGLHERVKAKRTELQFSLALLDSGLLKAVDEAQLALRYNMTVEQVRDYRRRYRKNIELQKDELFVAKKLVEGAFNDAVKLRIAVTKSILDGDEEMAKKIALAARMAEQCLPLSDLIRVAEAYKNPDGPTPSGATQVNIQVNNEMSKAEEAIQRRRAQNAIEVKLEGNK